MKNLKIPVLLILLFFPIFGLFAVNFSSLNLSNDNRLMFRADFEGQSAVFMSRLTDMTMQQLTALPEKMYIVDNGRAVIALNRFGAVRIPVSGGLPSTIRGYPSFTQGNIPLKGRLQDIAVSADGRWLLHLEPVSYGYGNLLLINTSNGAVRVVSQRVELPDSDFPAKWSPDSRLFVYSKGGRLFYFPIMEDMSVLIDERLRMIGPGRITSVLWGQHGDFYYITGNTLYRVINPELFTRTIYGDFLSIGRVSAVLPIEFDSCFDRYWIAPDSGSILVSKNKKGAFFFLLGENRNNAGVLPHIPIPHGAENFNVLWPLSGPLTISYSHKNQITALRFEITGNIINTIITETAPSAPNGRLSPDGTRAVFWGNNGAELWDYTNWRMIQKLNSDEIISCVWINNRHLIAGGSRFIEEINVSNPSFPRRIISLSKADEFGFEETSRENSRILARTGNEWFANDGTNPWTAVTNVQMRQVSLASDRFRVFLEPQVTEHFRNSIMIRNTQSTGTSSLTARHTANSVYTLGQEKKIAICFDLYDDDTGLFLVLGALRRFNIRATFFLNGEFIRRNPVSALAIAEAGHETASLFYAPIDLSDTRYRITREFIAQGLARNEDEFHRATGRELSILWHPPFYRNSNIVSAAASAAGYINVTRSIDPGDWISREDSLRLNLRQIPPAEIIDRIFEQKEAGSIIPVRIGVLPGGRDEYLFQRIEVLIDALIRSGYRIVPVSEVIR